MSNTRNPRAAVPAAKNEAGNSWLLLLLALLVLGMIAGSPAVRAETPNSGVKEGISAFETGAFGIALKKLEPLAKANNSEASYWLGRMYEDGLGVKKNADKAITYYTKSAEAGWQDAKLRLGEIYFHGTEELQNFVEAHKWLERAAFDGNSLAQRDLGTLYANGWGVQKDPVWAYVWYEFAAKQGDYEAQRLRDSLLKTMPADQTTEAQKLSQKIAPEVFGQVRDRSNQTPNNSDNTGNNATTPAQPGTPSAN